ncbi:MAG: alpha/beta fold hydrolase [Halopseudomonas sabulinigri]
MNSASKAGNPAMTDLVHAPQWHPQGSVRANIIICHGMAEHGARYARLASNLTREGIAVYAPNLRGHGPQAEAKPGQLPGGWLTLESDLLHWVNEVRALYPDAPLMLLGHSMGSYLVQGFLLKHSALIDAVILSGSNAHPPTLSWFGRIAAQIEGRLRAPDAPAQTLGKLSFGQFNKAFAPNRTEFDWLSRDTAEVDAYINDPLCGFTLTATYWRGLFSTLLRIADKQQLANIKAGLPILIIGGENDPVSAGDGLRKLQQRLQQAQLQRVELVLYPQARHEIFNEINKDQVTSDTLNWIMTTLSLNTIENPADENA